MFKVSWLILFCMVLAAGMVEAETKSSQIRLDSATPIITSDTVVYPSDKEWITYKKNEENHRLCPSGKWEKSKKGREYYLYTTWTGKNEASQGFQKIEVCAENGLIRVAK